MDAHDLPSVNNLPHFLVTLIYVILYNTITSSHILLKLSLIHVNINSFNILRYSYKTGNSTFKFDISYT